MDFTLYQIGNFNKFVEEWLNVVDYLLESQLLASCGKPKANSWLRFELRNYTPSDTGFLSVKCAEQLK